MTTTEFGPADTPTLAAPRTWRTTLLYYILVAVVILAIKLIFLAADHSPMFFLGDSAFYLATAKKNAIPHDRSFLYGWMIRFIAFKPGSLTNLVIAQSLASAACAFLGVVILRHYFRASKLLAAAVGILCALEPLQLFYERYVMTEAFSLLAFAAFVLAALAFLRRPSWWGSLFLVAMQIAGLLMIAIRFSYLPIVQVSTLLVPVLALFTPVATKSLRWPRFATHLLISIALFYSLHTAYKDYYVSIVGPKRFHSPPTYLCGKGAQLLCFVVPIVEPQDFPDPAKRDAVFKTKFDLKDPAKRAAHRWLKGGLVRNIKDAYENPFEAYRMAEITAHNALKRDPLGEIRLAKIGFLDYWNFKRLQQGLKTDRGVKDLTPELLEDLKSDYHLDAKSFPNMATLSNQYYFFAWPWYLALLLLPVPAFLLIFRTRSATRPGAFLLFTFAAIQIVVISVCTISPTPRFFHPLAWQAPILIGALLIPRPKPAASLSIPNSPLP